MRNVQENVLIFTRLLHCNDVAEAPRSIVSMKQDSDLCSRSYIWTPFGLGLFTFCNIYHTFMPLWNIWTGQNFIDFLFRFHKKRFSTTSKKRLKSTGSWLCKKEAKAESSVPDFQKGFPSYNFVSSSFFTTVKSFLFVFHPSFISINLWHEKVLCLFVGAHRMSPFSNLWDWNWNWMGSEAKVFTKKLCSWWVCKKKLNFLMQH